jgi:hypothetical protein
MMDTNAGAASAQRWADALHGHWHDARPSDATAARQVIADDRAASDRTHERLAHEGRVKRWEHATHRTWNRKHGNAA